MKKELVCLFMLCGIARGSSFCYSDYSCVAPNSECSPQNICVCRSGYRPYYMGRTLTRCYRDTWECNKDNDCSGHYQKCWKGECVCKYPATTRGKEDVTKCQRPNSCDYYRKPCHSDRMMCIAEDCECRANYRTLTDSYGIITDCYIVDCYNDNECGVFEKCEKEKCTCSVWPETKPGHNTTCVGTFCLSENCGDYQECGKRNDRCACKYGTITRSNRTTVCVNPYSCTSDGECTINGYCLNNTCQCGDGFNGDIDDQGKFQCKENTVMTTETIAGIAGGVIAFVIMGIIITVGCVRRYRRRGRLVVGAARSTRTNQRRYLPLPLTTSTAHLLNNEPLPRTPSYEYHSNPYKPDDWPAADDDQPPSYEVVMGLTTPLAVEETDD